MPCFDAGWDEIAMIGSGTRLQLGLGFELGLGLDAPEGRHQTVELAGDAVRWNGIAIARLGLR